MMNGAPAAVVRVAPDRGQAEAWSLVLEAIGVAHRLDATAEGWAIAVDGADAARAIAALEAHDREAEEQHGDEPPAPDLGRSLAGVLVPAALVGFFALTGERALAEGAGPWFKVGSAAASRIVAGEWWRAITALTLHADLAHVLGNALAGAVFFSALCRWLGAGLGGLLVLVAGMAGNLITAFAYASRHDSVGASTAVFGALGILGGLQFLRRFRWKGRLDRRRRALTAVGACLGIFAMVGVGERSDVVAHASGLGAGLVLGLLVGRLLGRPVGRVGQALLGAAAALAIAGAWRLALDLA